MLDVLPSTAKGAPNSWWCLGCSVDGEGRGPSSGGGVKSSGGVGGGSGVQRLRRTELVRGYLVSRIGAHIFAGGLSQYPEFLARVFDLQFDCCAGICVVSCHWQWRWQSCTFWVTPIRLWPVLIDFWHCYQPVSGLGPGYE